MKSKASQFLKSILTALICSVLSAACGGGGGGDLQSPSTDLTGNWSVTETTNGNCPGSIYPEVENYTAAVSQSGNNFTYTNMSDGSVRSGTISGNTITINENRPSGSGTLTSNFSGTVSNDGNSFSGSGSWTWTGSSSSCSGTSDVIAAR